MRGHDLMREWVDAVGKAGKKHVDALVRRLHVSPDVIYTGMPFGLMAGTAVFGVASVITYDDGTYSPSDLGKPAVIMPSWLRGPVYMTDVEDLVAWFPSRPDQWWLRCGASSFINEPAVMDAQREGSTLHLYASPLDWLRGGCRDDSAVILDWTGARLALGGLKITCHGLGLGEKVDRLLAGRKPEIMIVDSFPEQAAA
ncbi:MAG: hypothetical protein LDL26_00045 [Caenispirillum bisanense]|nr:hypothetical protein [Caenispirillum bisanense]MCA1971259.1 hypothetical protein [Caenispirillum sp.]